MRKFPAGKRNLFSRLAGNLTVSGEPVRDCWRGMSSRLNMKARMRWVKEIKVPDRGTKVGLNLITSAAPLRGQEGTGI